MATNAASLAITLLLKADIAGFEGKMRKLDASMKGHLKKWNSYAHKSIQKGVDLKKAGLSNMTAGAAAVAPIALMVREAAKLEDKIADVAKVTNTDFGSSGFKQLTKTAMDVSEHLGRSAGEAAELMANLAAGGVAKADLKAVAIQAGEIGVAFDVSAGEAGQAYMTIKNAMNLTSKQTTATLDAMNAATNKFGGKASELLNFMAQGGAGVAQTLKVAGTDMQAFGNAFQVIGKGSSEAATTMQRFQKAVLGNKELRAIFNKAGGGSAGLVAILDKANKSGEAYTYLKNHGVGEYSSNLAQVANNMNSDKGLKAQLAYLQNPENVKGSAHQEFLNRQKTTTEQFNKLKTAAMNTGISLGASLLPALKDLMDELKPILDTVSKWIKNNPKLVGGILKVVAASAALKIGVGALQFGFGGFLSVGGKMVRNGTRIVGFFSKGKEGISQFSKAISGTKKVTGAIGLVAKSGAQKAASGTVLAFESVKNGMKTFGKVAKSGVVKGIQGIGKAFSFVGKLMMANPWLIAIMAIAAAVYLVIKYWKPIKVFFIKLWDWVKGIFSKAWQWIKKMFLNYTPYGLIIKHWDVISEFFVGLWDKVKNAFSVFWDWVKKWAETFKDVGINLVLAIWDGLKQKWEWLKTKAVNLWNKLKSVFGMGKSTAEVAATMNNNKAGGNPASNLAFAKADIPKIVPVRGGNTYSNPFNLSVSVSAPATQKDADLIVRTVKKNMKGIMGDYNHNQSRTGFGNLNLA